MPLRPKRADRSRLINYHLPDLQTFIPCPALTARTPRIAHAARTSPLPHTARTHRRSPRHARSFTRRFSRAPAPARLRTARATHTRRAHNASTVLRPRHMRRPTPSPRTVRAHSAARTCTHRPCRRLPTEALKLLAFSFLQSISNFAVNLPNVSRRCEGATVPAVAALTHPRPLEQKRSSCRPLFSEQ